MNNKYNMSEIRYASKGWIQNNYVWILFWFFLSICPNDTQINTHINTQVFSGTKKLILFIIVLNGVNKQINKQKN